MYNIKKGNNKIISIQNGYFDAMKWEMSTSLSNI